LRINIVRSIIIYVRTTTTYLPVAVASSTAADREENSKGKRAALMCDTLTLKFGNMQVPQEFVLSTCAIVATDKKMIILQSETSIGRLDPITGDFWFTDAGSHHHDLGRYGERMDIPEEIKNQIIQAFPGGNKDFTKDMLQEIIGMTIQRFAHYESIIKTQGSDPSNASMVETAKKRRYIVSEIQRISMEMIGIQ
jgi:hypothetical protein